MANWVHNGGLGYAVSDTCPGDGWLPLDGDIPGTDAISLALSEIEDRYAQKARDLKDQMLTIRMADGETESANTIALQQKWVEMQDTKLFEILTLIGGI